MKYTYILVVLLMYCEGAFAHSFYSIEVGDEKLEYISYEIGSKDYVLKVGASLQAQNLSSLAPKYNAISGINGVFFCPEDYSECNQKNYTINERFIEGHDLSYYDDTGARGVFGWNSSGDPFIYQTGEINIQERENIYEGLGNYPILFLEGQNLLENYIDTGLYDTKMQLDLPRHFICSNKEKTHIYFGRSSPMSLEKLTGVIYAVGCWDALNLDAGRSAHFLYNGYRHTSGSRKILDGFFIENKNINTKEEQEKVDNILDSFRSAYTNLSKERMIRDFRLAQIYFHKKSIEIYRKNSRDILDDLGKRIGSINRFTSIEDERDFYKYNLLEYGIRNIIDEGK